MKHTFWIWAASSLLVAIGSAGAHEGHDGHDHGSTLPACPLMGEPIDLAFSARTDAGPVFFCCGGCVEKFEKNPDKYAAKVAVQREAMAKLPKIQVLCPVSGKGVDSKVSFEHDGKKVNFCCNGCVEKYKANPAEYQANLANSYTYQTKCPVMGETINPAASVDLPTGQKIYLCCQRCERGLLTNPAKYASKLAAQGIHIDPEAIMKTKLGG